MAVAAFYQVKIYDADTIDTAGFSVCWKCGVEVLAEAVHKNYPDKIILDGNRLVRLPYVVPVVKADATHLAVSAASILAKYTQVCAMEDIHRKYPKYGFNIHHGYGTADHKKKLKELGPCPEHRKSFRPVKNLSRPSGRART